MVWPGRAAALGGDASVYLFTYMEMVKAQNGAFCGSASAGSFLVPF